MGRREIAGFGLAGLAIAAWAFNFVIARGISTDIPPLWLTFLRWSIAGVVLLPFAFGLVKKSLPAIKRHWRLILLTAVVGIGLFNSTIYWGAQTSEAAKLAIIATASPVFNLFFSRFAGMAVSGLQYLGSALAIIGIAVLVGQGDPRLWITTDFVIGDLWMLGGALLWSIYTELLLRKPKDIGMTAFHTACIWMALPLLGILAFWQAPPSALHITPPVVGSVIYLGLVASIFCYYCWNAAITRIGTMRTGFVYYTLPLLAAFEAFVFLGETLKAYHFWAMFLVITGIMMSIKKRPPIRQTV